MNSCFLNFLTAFSLLLMTSPSTHAQEQVKSVLLGEPDDSTLRRLPNFFFTTEAYQREAFRALIEEANRVAMELNLPEKLPIAKSNLVEVFIQPPASGAIGTISSSNYVYFASVGKKFSGLNLRNQEETFDQAAAKYTWPISRLDTNAAFQVATKIMATVSMDVKALNRDFTIDTTASMTEGPHGRHFVPVYRVRWLKAGKSIAAIEFLEPTKSISHLAVYDPKYILREPIRVPNLAQLLNQTNTPAKQSTPAKSSNTLNE